MSCCTEHNQERKEVCLRKKNIIVEVSGSRFCIVPSLFQHIENLDWKKKKKRKSSSSGNKNKIGEETVIVFKLNANPDIFEYVLQFFLSGKLPDKNKSSHRKAKGLIEFVATLDQVAVKPLIDHMESILMESSSSSSSSSLTSSSKTFLKRSLHSLSSSVASRAVNLIPSSSPRQSSILITTTGNITTSSETTTGAKRKKSSIPSQIDSFTTKIVDDGSISKLSLQSSSSGILSVQDENDYTMPTTSSYAHEKISLVEGNALNKRPQQYNNVQRCGAYNTNNNNPYSTTGPVTTANDCTNNSATSRQSQIIPKNPFTTIIDNADGGNKRNAARAYSDNNKWSSSKKILYSVLGKSNNQEHRSQMTHAEWCSTEYVV